MTWFKSYLSYRKQRVVLPGTVSDWLFLNARVPQGSFLGPLLFLLYINDIVLNIGYNIRLFADDTSLFIIVDNPVTDAACINSDLGRITQWAATWLVTFNPVKTESMLISRKLNGNRHPPLFMLNQQISEVNAHKHLGLILSKDCSWHEHIKYITEKAWTRINIMRKLKFELDRKSLETIYIAFIRPILEYGDIIWDNCTQNQKTELDKIQNETARIATGVTKLVSINALYSEIRWDKLETRRKNHRLTLFYKMNHNLTPLYLTSLVPESVGNVSRYNLRNPNNLQGINTRTAQYQQSFPPSTIKEWNELSNEAKECSSVNSFKYYLNKNRKHTPKYFYTGNRKAQILHTRLRTNCSSLNLDLFLKNIADTPHCNCGTGSIEDQQHYFFHCPNYQLQRAQLFNVISIYQAPTLHLLLHGDVGLSTETNKTIFENVHKFILETKRFT